MPVNPVSGVTVTVNVADWPGVTVRDGGLTSIVKSAVGGITVIVRVGGLGSELPLASITVSEAMYVARGAEGDVARGSARSRSPASRRGRPTSTSRRGASC